MKGTTGKLRSFIQSADRALESRDVAAATDHLAQAAELALQDVSGADGQSSAALVARAKELVELTEIARKLSLTASASPKTSASPRPSRRQHADEKHEDGPEWLVAEKPPVRFDDIIGLDDVKRRVRGFVIKFRNPSELEKWPMASKGDRLLLFGPPGTGKTMFASAVANEIDADFYQVKGSNILDKWVGSSQQNVARLFSAVSRSERAVVFLDELDGLLSKRGGSSSVRDGVVSEFLQEMEGLSTPNSSLLFIGATNQPWALDDAVIDRFGGLFYIPLPPRESRLAWLERGFAAFPYGFSPDISLEDLADRMEGQSMRIMRTLLVKLSDAGYVRATDGGSGQITAKDVAEALRSLPKPVDDKEIAKYRSYASGATR